MGVVEALALCLTWAQSVETSQAQEARQAPPYGRDPAVIEAVDRLVEGLEKGPFLRPDGSDRFRLFVVDVETGEAAPIVDEPEKGRARCGSPCWSPDGRRILFDATPLDLWQLSRIESLDLADGRPRMTDLGSGRFPSFSPDGKRIAFSLVRKTNGKDAPGIWVMWHDGSRRRWLSGPGRPLWSPDRRRLLVVDHDASPPLWIMGVNDGESRPITLVGKRIFPTPAWASETTLVAAIGQESPDTVVVIDVSDPEGASVKEILWSKTGGPDVEPGEIAYCPETGRCVFVGAVPAGKALYCLRRGDPTRPRRIELAGFDPNLGDLAFSPGGRYLLFHTDNPDRPRGRPAPAASPRPEAGAAAAEAASLVAALERAPVLRPGGSDRDRVFFMELATGRSRPVLDEPGRRLSFCGSISWSCDGRRIIFDANPTGGLYQMAHIKSVEVAGGRPVMTEHKPGNCPSLSPDGRQIAYLANPGGDSTEQPGAWVMRADGSDPRYLDIYGAPHWSPDGRQLLVSGFGVPLVASIIDPKTGEHRRIRLRGKTLIVAPEWVGEHALLGILGANSANEIALIDVSEPEQASVKEILWEKPAGVEMSPSDVVYDAQTGHCVFAAVGAGGMRLYQVERGKPDTLKRLDSEGPDAMIADLALSPDGRYLLFRSNNSDRGSR
jgi:Tol biopolymer transport system component